ncbi:hypothetical protein [Azonexus sp. IMCC34839]|uniref:hypothetical protein n=1 Tax=Azonexus sp. IMCC34839 TaxID=3133695 RepID=UPI00399B7534
MYLLLTDETNLQAGTKVEFFSYGGLIVSAAKVAELHTRIAEIRKVHGYLPGDKLKFDTNARPKQVTVEAATTAKRDVIGACIACDCKFIAYVILHAIVRNTPLETTIQWGADHVIGKFNFFLHRQDAMGIVAMDRLPDGVEFDYLSNKFSGGLKLQEGESVDLDRITLFSSTCINASHLSSAMDIVLGSWRYCINSPMNTDAAKAMMVELTKLIWCEREGDKLFAFEKGLVFRPKEVQVAGFQAKYSALLNHINALIAHV